jgi:hypothetical protein
VGSTDRVSVVGVDDEHACADDVLGRSSDLGERGDDDVEAALGLHLGVGIHRAVRPDRRRAGDEHTIADPHGP